MFTCKFSSNLLEAKMQALKVKKDEVGTAAHAKLVEQVRNVKLHGAFRNVELAGDFLVRKIFQQRIEDFLFAAAEVGDGIGLQAAALSGKDGVNKSGEKLPRNPESSSGNQRERADQLFAGFYIGEKAFNAETQERKAIGLIVLFADDTEARFGKAFEKIGQESAGGGLRGMRVNDVNLSFGRLQGTEVGRKSGFQLLDNHLKLRFR